MPNEYRIGTTVRFSVTFKAGTVETEPPPNTSIKFKHKNGDGGVLTKTYITDADVVRDSAGKYRIDLVADVVGNWNYRWEGTGNAYAAEEGVCIVKATTV